MSVKKTKIKNDMETKTLKLKRVYAWVIYNNLLKIAPKNYPSTAEINSTLEFLAAFKPAVEKYREIMKKVDQVREDVQAKKVTDEEVKKIEVELDAEWRAYNKGEGSNEVEIELSEDSLQILKTQFERNDWGKLWVVTIEEFAEILGAINAALK